MTRPGSSTGCFRSPHRGTVHGGQILPKQLSLLCHVSWLWNLGVCFNKGRETETLVRLEWHQGQGWDRTYTWFMKLIHYICIIKYTICMIYISYFWRRSHAVPFGSPPGVCVCDSCKSHDTRFSTWPPVLLGLKNHSFLLELQGISCIQTSFIILPKLCFNSPSKHVGSVGWSKSLNLNKNYPWNMLE